MQGPEKRTWKNDIHVEDVLLGLALLLGVLGLIALAVILPGCGTTSSTNTDTQTQATQPLPQTNPPASTIPVPTTPTPIRKCHSVNGSPDPKCTPGATSQQLKVCQQSTRTVRPPVSYTDKLKRLQLNAYDYTDKNLRDYEEDHLIPLALGGNPTSAANLWPEPRYQTSPGALTSEQKDDLETYEWHQVCLHQKNLQQAQQIFQNPDLRSEYLKIHPPHATFNQQGA